MRLSQLPLSSGTQPLAAFLPSCSSRSCACVSVMGMVGVSWEKRAVYLRRDNFDVFAREGEPAQHHTIKLKDHQLWAKLIYGWLRIKHIRERHKLPLSLQHPHHPTALMLLSGGQLAQDCTPTGLESGRAVGAGVTAHSFALVL